MQRLFDTTSQDELMAAKMLLESRGVPVYIGGEGSFRINRRMTAYQRSLWVMLDQHYEDAQKLLDDPAHEVAEPVDVAAFYEAFEKQKASPLKALLGLESDAAMNWLLVLVVIALGGMALFALRGG